MNKIKMLLMLTSLSFFNLSCDSYEELLRGIEQHNLDIVKNALNMTKHASPTANSFFFEQLKRHNKPVYGKNPKNSVDCNIKRLVGLMKQYTITKGVNNEKIAQIIKEEFNVDLNSHRRPYTGYIK